MDTKGIPLEVFSIGLYVDPKLKLTELVKVLESVEVILYVRGGSHSFQLSSLPLMPGLCRDTQPLDLSKNAPTELLDKLPKQERGE